MCEFEDDADLTAYVKCLAELNALEARVDRCLRLNDMNQVQTLIAELIKLAGKLRQSRRAIEDKVFH